jgi:predicted nucleic acid-binding protein
MGYPICMVSPMSIPARLIALRKENALAQQEMADKIVVLTAKNRGIIPKARPVIEEMMGAGLYLSRKVVEAALLRVGE